MKIIADNIKMIKILKIDSQNINDDGMNYVLSMCSRIEILGL